MTSECKIPQAKCMDDGTIQTIRNIIKISKENPVMGGMLPLSSNDIKTMEEAVKKFEVDCITCATMTGNSKECMDAAHNNLRRNMPMSANKIYPWRNYDWDYSNHTANNYSTKALPVNNMGSNLGILQAGQNLVTAMSGFIDAPSPSPASSINRPDQTSDYPIFECRGDNRCIGTEKVKRNINQTVPTTDKFLQNKVDGEYSSSYYYKISSCKRPDITDQNTCEKQGYTWTPDPLDSKIGSCVQPRYGFIDNSPKPFFNGSNAKGFIPAIGNDLMDIMPDKLFNSLLGQSTTGLQIQDCPKIESFSDITESYGKRMIMILLICSIGLYISIKLKK